MTRLRILTPAAALAVFAVIALPASAAAPTVTLNLKGGYANQTRTACGIEHHYTAFHVLHPITVSGSVLPAPTGTWEVKVKIKKCITGRFRTVWTTHARGNPDGSFKTFYKPRRRGYYFARAYDYAVTPAARSDKQYFHAA